MRYRELIQEKYDRNRNVIVVDIQPAYNSNDSNYVSEAMWFLNNMSGNILMLVNADNDGFTEDDEHTIKSFWVEHGFDEERFDDTEYVDKGYGFLRSWMDNGVDEGVIIKTIREMYKHKVNDSRQLFGGEDSDNYAELFEEFVGADHFQDFMLYDPLIVEWLSIKLLKEFTGSYIIGGGREECLREVQLLMNAFNIRYKEINHLIY